MILSRSLESVEHWQLPFRLETTNGRTQLRQPDAVHRECGTARIEAGAGRNPFLTSSAGSRSAKPRARAQRRKEMEQLPRRFQGEVTGRDGGAGNEQGNLR